MLTVLTGDIISAGDQVIVERGIALLKHYYPDKNILKLPRWKPIQKDLDQVNQSDALILLGGPAFQRDLYPGIFPLVRNLDHIKVPIISMGLGSSIIPFNENMVKKFRFTESSFQLLNRLVRDSEMIGVRDYVTKKILENHNIKNVFVTGCPGWFSLDNLGKPIVVNDIKNVAFATGFRHFRQKSSFYQQLEIMNFLKDYFDNPKLFCVFQDSLESDKFKKRKYVSIQRLLANEAQKLGYEIVDVTGRVKKMWEVYLTTDILISYRVHSHISMLSFGKPSILISEDSRGYGANDLIGLKNIFSYRDENIIFSRLYGYGIFGTVGTKLFPPKTNKRLKKEISEFLNEEMNNGFARYAGIHSVLLQYYKNMEKFLLKML